MHFSNEFQPNPLMMRRGRTFFLRHFAKMFVTFLGSFFRIHALAV
jgi:hypothetical protein